MTFPRLSPRAHRIPSFRNGLRHENGAAMVEFALSFAIFTMVSVGIMILCMALFTYEYVDYASREAARWAMVRGANCSALVSSMPGCPADETAILNYVQNMNFPLIDKTKLTTSTVQATWWQLNEGTNSTTGAAYAYWSSCGSSPDGCSGPGDQVQVTISYPFSMSIPFFGSFSPYVSSSSQMAISF